MPHLPSKSRTANAVKIDTHPLFSRPHRIAIPTLLILLILYNLALLAWGIVLSLVSDLAYWGPGYVVIAILKWHLIPLICTLASIIQTVQRRRRTLESSRVVLVGTISALAWIGYGFLGFVEANAWTEGFDGTMFYMGIAGIVLNLVYVGFGAAAMREGKKSKRRMRMELPAYTAGESRPPSYGPTSSGEFERDGKEDI